LQFGATTNYPKEPLTVFAAEWIISHMGGTTRAAFAAIPLIFISAATAQPSCFNSMTGAAVPSMAGLDQVMQSALSKYGVPGAALSVSNNGRLVFARGYGCADQTANTAVQPDSLFRVASVSKTFTAVGIMQLVQQGKLSLDATVFDTILTGYEPLPGKTTNPDLLKITVRHLLEHTGGWDRGTTQTFNGVKYNEPLDDLLAAAAKATGHPAPATPADVITVMLSQPLQHSPGTYYAYSNFGYCLLGRIIEQVSGMGYEQYVQQNILKPLGIGRQKLGATLQSDVNNGEVTYYDYPNAPLAHSVFPGVTGLVPAPYGSHFMEDVDSAGEWATTTVDLTRFLNGIWGAGGGTALLNPQTIASMQADPQVQNESPGSFYGLGFVYQKISGGLRWTKDGGLSGTSSYVVVNPVSGWTWAVVFNSNPTGGDVGTNFVGDVVGQLETALGQVTASAVPKNDQYAGFKSTLSTPAFSATAPVVNGATYQPGMVSGSWVQITGQNLATATRIWWADEVVGSTLPTEIDHVRVTINGKNAAVYYVSPTQLNVQAPTDATTGPVNIQVIRDGTASAVISANYVASAPGFFTYSAGGRSYAAGVHLNGAYVGDTAGFSPAVPGETIELFATGLGTTLGGVAPGVTLMTPPPVVMIGNSVATVQAAALIYPGEWQLNVKVPQVAAGEQPVTISYGGATSPAGIYLAVGGN
jgi:N-acyl-D-amino-acid deacylase